MMIDVVTVALVVVVVVERVVVIVSLLLLLFRGNLFSFDNKGYHEKGIVMWCIWCVCCTDNIPYRYGSFLPRFSQYPFSHTTNGWTQSITVYYIWIFPYHPSCCSKHITANSETVASTMNSLWILCMVTEHCDRLNRQSSFKNTFFRRQWWNQIYQPFLKEK